MMWAQDPPKRPSAEACRNELTEVLFSLIDDEGLRRVWRAAYRQEMETVDDPIAVWTSRVATEHLPALFSHAPAHRTGEIQRAASTPSVRGARQPAVRSPAGARVPQSGGLHRPVHRGPGRQVRRVHVLRTLLWSVRRRAPRTPRRAAEGAVVPRTDLREAGDGASERRARELLGAVQLAARRQHDGAEHRREVPSAQSAGRVGDQQQSVSLPRRAARRQPRLDRNEVARLAVHVHLRGEEGILQDTHASGMTSRPSAHQNAIEQLYSQSPAFNRAFIVQNIGLCFLSDAMGLPQTLFLSLSHQKSVLSRENLTKLIPLSFSDNSDI